MRYNKQLQVDALTRALEPRRWLAQKTLGDFIVEYY